MTRRNVLRKKANGANHIATTELQLPGSVTPTGALDVPHVGYEDAEFEKDLNKARVPLEQLAEKARQSLKNGTARKFPE